MTPDETPDAAALRERLQPILRAEVATIGTLELIMHHQDEPGYVILYQAAKTGKQASAEQMVTLLRTLGERPSERGGPLESVLKLQSLLTQKVSTTATLAAMQLVQAEIVERYRDAHASLDGRARAALRRPYHRAVKHWVTIVAHLVQRRDGDPGLEEKLPLPRDAYFATAEDRVCMRCLFDRAGALPALERSEPRPYQYVCAACHDEVLADFPPDLLAQADRWPASLREDRVIERALGRPEKLRAEHDVLARLSGLSPELPEPAAARAAESPIVRTPKRTFPQPPSVLDLSRDATELELAYTDLLFDFRSVRMNW